MPTVKQILAAKSAGVRTIEATHTVYAAVTLLAAYEIGALVVVEGSRAVGIFRNAIMPARAFSRRVGRTRRW